MNFVRDFENIFPLYDNILTSKEEINKDMYTEITLLSNGVRSLINKIVEKNRNERRINPPKTT